MFKIGKKIICFILVGFLTFSVTSFTYYRSVHAMEWVGGALAFEEALKWLLAAIGITATAGMTDAYWDTYGDDFTEYAIENGATQQEVTEWQMKLCEGILDKGSVVWDKFKNWAYNTISSNNNIPSIGAYKGIGNIISSEFPNIQNITGLSNINDIEFDIAILQYNGSNYGVKFLKGYYIGTLYNNGYYLYPNNSSSYCVQSHSRFDNTTTSIHLDRYYGNEQQITGSSGSKVYGLSRIPNVWSYWNIDNLLSDKAFNSVATNINDLDVISSDGVDEDNPEVTLPYPGVSTSDDEISKDAYQDIIDDINDGTITQEQGMEQIQEILKIVTYDTVTDKVIPPQVDPDTGEDKTKDDVLKENKENMSFTLGGLENVFPFCIPWDIYAFLTILDAPAVAPSFEYPFYNVSTKDFDMYVIDLSVWEPVAVVSRYGCDLMFIIGLALATRRLIGAGGGD